MLLSFQQALKAIDTLPLDPAGNLIDPNDGVIGHWQLEQALQLAVGVFSRVAADTGQFLTYDELQRRLNVKAEKLPDKPVFDDPSFDPPGQQYSQPEDRQIAHRWRYNQALKLYHETLQTHQKNAANTDQIRRRFGYGLAHYLGYVDDAVAELAQASSGAPLAGASAKAFLKERRCLPIPEATARYGTFIVGNHGSGKSEVIKHRVWHYLTKPRLNETIIVFDPHGEMAPEIARMKPNFGSDRLVYIDPLLDPEFIPSPRVLSTDDKSPDNLFREAEHYGEALRMISGSVEPSQSGNMESICRNCAHVVLEHDHYNLKSLMELLAVELPKKGRPERDVPPIYHDACENSPNVEIQQHFQHGFLYGNYGMAKNALLGRMERIVTAPALQRMLLGAPTFDLAKLIEQRKVIVINLPMGQLTDNVTGMIGQLLMAQIAAAVRKRDLTKIETYAPVHVFIDEAQHFVSHATAGQINELRKYGFSLTLATQYVDRFPATILEAVKGLCVQIAGYCTGKNLTAMNAVFDLTSKSKDHDDTTVLQRQSVGQFHFRTRGAEGAPEIKTRQFSTATNLLYKGQKWRDANANHFMTDAEWEQTKAEQLSRYYRKREAETGPKGGGSTPGPSQPEPIPNKPEPTPQPSEAKSSKPVPPLKPKRGFG